jgi:hypothetical protein
MLNLYRYLVERGMKRLSDVPEPYQTMLRNEGYTDEE